MASGQLDALQSTKESVPAPPLDTEEKACSDITPMQT